MVENQPVQRQWWCFSCHTWTGLEAAVLLHSACWATFSAPPLDHWSWPIPLCTGPETLSLLWKRNQDEGKSKKVFDSLLNAHAEERRTRFKNCLPPGRGFRIKSTTSFQSFFRIALKQGRQNPISMPYGTLHNLHHAVTICANISPANLVRGYSCGAKALHAIVVNEAHLFEGRHGPMDLLICSWDVPEEQAQQ